MTGSSSALLVITFAPKQRWILLASERLEKPRRKGGAGRREISFSCELDERPTHAREQTPSTHADRR